MLVLSMLAILLSFTSTNAQDGIDSNGNSSNCIGKYRDLQIYILSNEDLIDNLTEVFFKTGKAPTEFVRITYEFQTLLSIDNHTNNTNISTINYDNNNDDELIYVDIQKKFIWSNSALYLLGPEPLLWLTLFAVNVRQSSITINLPFLCNDAYDDLLPRLTYLVSVQLCLIKICT